MKLPNLKKRPANARALHNGAYAAVLTAAVLAAVILLNLVVQALPTKFTEFDISTGGMFTLSDTTKDLLRGLPQEVQVYYLAQTGDEDGNVTRLLDRYADESGRLRWEQRDPVLYPTFAQKYTDASTGSLVVTSGEKYKVVDYNSLYEMDWESYYTTGSMDYSFKAENAVTTAVAEVIRTNTYRLCQLTGHGETALSSDYTETLQNSGIEVSELSLVTAGGVPEDTAAVLINAPQTDLTDSEADTLRQYLQNGGSLLAATDLTVDTPRLDALLAEAGLTRQEGLLVETDAGHYAYGYSGTYLLPEVTASAVTAGVNSGMYVFAPIAQGVLYDEDNTEWEYTGLLSTSASAYAMAGYADAVQPEKADTDPEGAFDVAVAAENTGTGAKVVWAGCANLLSASMNQAVSGGNAQFLGSVANWFTGEENAAVIEGRSMSAESLTVPSGSIVGLGVLFTILLPVALVVLGIVVCVIRRRK